MSKQATKRRKPLRGKALVAAAMNQILKHPKTWGQGSAHCGSRHCFFGWIQILGGGNPQAWGALIDALRFAPQLRDHWAYRAERTLRELYQFSKELISDRPFTYASFTRKMIPLKVPTQKKVRQ